MILASIPTVTTIPSWYAESRAASKAPQLGHAPNSSGGAAIVARAPATVSAHRASSGCFRIMTPRTSMARKSQPETNRSGQLPMGQRFRCEAESQASVRLMRVARLFRTRRLFLPQCPGRDI